VNPNGKAKTVPLAYGDNYLRSLIRSRGLRWSSSCVTPAITGGRSMACGRPPKIMKTRWMKN